MIEETETAMETKRLVKQVWLNLLSALLGSIFGLMRSFAGALGFCELFVDRYYLNKNYRKKIKELEIRKIGFKDVLYSKRTLFHGLEKIHPIVTVQEANVQTISN